uniref:Uncharacterized protein n=1 Tax=Anguilla anguilla TaxID=7936 RepID=A0A0E9T2V2_ANGAN
MLLTELQNKSLTVPLETWLISLQSYVVVIF